MQSKIISISSNMLKTFEECPQKYIFQYMEHIQIPQNSDMAEKGKNIHALINYYLKGFDVTKLTKSLGGEEKNLWENFLSLKIEKNSIFDSEYQFNVRIENTLPFWLTGRIDAIEIAKENETITILDWKTGNIPKNPENDPQTLVYTLAMSMILKRNNISFKYVNLKTGEIDEIQANETYISEAKNKIISTAKKILKPTMPPKYKPEKIVANCYNCKYKYLCQTDVFL